MENHRACYHHDHKIGLFNFLLHSEFLDYYLTIQALQKVENLRANIFSYRFASCCCLWRELCAPDAPRWLWAVYLPSWRNKAVSDSKQWEKQKKFSNGSKYSYIKIILSGPGQNWLSEIHSFFVIFWLLLRWLTHYLTRRTLFWSARVEPRPTNSLCKHLAWGHCLKIWSLLSYTGFLQTDN